ncbi:MAG TPA: hypothetical protein VMB79_15310 [Jatrophihabitans sp.]|nr:hypothetical protein [Jatrophihabitans sp.]
MNDIFEPDSDAFERDLKRLLNQGVDARAGGQRSAPPFQAPVSEPIRPARAWLAPLAAAACVVALAGGTVGAARLLSSHRSLAPAATNEHPAPTSAVPTPAPSTGASGSTSASGSTNDSASGSATASGSASPAGSAASSGSTVQLRDASIWLPAGWSAVDSGQPSNPTAAEDTKWCVGPSSQHGSGTTCVAWLERSVQQANAGGGYDSDVPGVSPTAYPSICGSSVQPTFSVLDSGDRDFGGRTADYRLFRWSCSGGPARTFVKYLVPAGPAFELSAASADSELQATLADIVARSSLPAQASAVRYYDYGYVRSLATVPGGYRLTIDRVTPGPHGLVNDNPQTYEYFVSSGDWQVSVDHPAQGDLAVVETDGTNVIVTYKVSP